MKKKMIFAALFALTLLCCTACGRRMNSATDGTNKKPQSTQDTTVENNDSDGMLSNDTTNDINNDHNADDNFDNNTTNDNVVDGVVNGVEDAVDGLIDGVDDMVNGMENTVDNMTNDTNKKIK